VFALMGRADGVLVLVVLIICIGGMAMIGLTSLIQRRGPRSRDEGAAWWSRHQRYDGPPPAAGKAEPARPVAAYPDEPAEQAPAAEPIELTEPHVTVIPAPKTETGAKTTRKPAANKTSSAAKKTTKSAAKATTKSTRKNASARTRPSRPAKD